MELGSAMSLFSLFKFFFGILKRFEAFILRLFGRNSTLEEAWELETQTERTSIINIGFYTFSFLWIFKKLYQLSTYTPVINNQSTQSQVQSYAQPLYRGCGTAMYNTTPYGQRFY